jgi:hypothetical protein
MANAMTVGTEKVTLLKLFFYRSHRHHPEFRPPDLFGRGVSVMEVVNSIMVLLLAVHTLAPHMGDGILLSFDPSVHAVFVETNFAAAILSTFL